MGSPVLTVGAKTLPWKPRIARWCNGSTTDSESVCHGSNPCRAANLPSAFLDCQSKRPESFAGLQNFIGFLLRNALMKSFVAHHDRGGAAAGEAFDKFD